MSREPLSDRSDADDETPADILHVRLRDDDGHVERISLQAWVERVESRLRELEDRP